MWSMKLNDDLECTITYLPRLSDCVSPREIPQLSSDLEEQENQLANDLFAVMQGGEGYFVQYDASFDPSIPDDRVHGPKFRIDSRIHVRYKDIVNSIAKVASASYSVRVFSEIYGGLENGSVLNAIAASFRGLRIQFLNLMSEICAKNRAENRLENRTKNCFGNSTLLGIYVHFLPFEPFLFRARDFIEAFLKASKASSGIVIGEEVSRPEKLAQALSINYGPVKEFKGGSVLRLVSEMYRHTRGDADAVNLYEQLLISGSQPYLRMLTKWLTLGSLNDPYDEFLVQENSGTYVETAGTQFKEYWNRRFATRDSVAPIILDDKEIQRKILVSGKLAYVIVRAHNLCQNSTYSTSPSNDSEGTACDPSEWIEFSKQNTENLNTVKSVEDCMLIQYIDRTYEFANKEVMNILKTHKYGLEDFLTKLKNLYFFTGVGTDMENFLKFADKELLKPIREVEDVALKNALSMALSPKDIWAPFISVSKAMRPLKESLTDVFLYHQGTEACSDEGIGYDYVQIGFEPPFPLSTFVSERTIQRYQYISRFLLEIRRTYEIVQETSILRWRSPAYRSSESMHYYSILEANNLHMRMVNFITYLHMHCTSYGIGIFWDSFMKYCENAENLKLSDLEREHNLYLNKSLDNCFLTKEQVLKYVLLLLTTVKKYSLFLSANEKLTNYFSSARYYPVSSQLDDKQTAAEWFKETVGKFGTSFDHSLGRFHDAMDENVHLNGLADAEILKFKSEIRSVMRGS